MNAILKAIQSFLQALTLVLTLLRDDKLRREGERKAHLEEVESAYYQKVKAHEIDLKAVRGDFTDDDLERMRRYQRETR